MLIKLPKNTLGTTADPDNEAHMLAVTGKGFQAVVDYCAIEPDILKRKAMIARAIPLRVERAKAHEAAVSGASRWKDYMVSQGTTIRDYWDGEKIIWPAILDRRNYSSVMSFVLYLAHSISPMPPVLMQAIADAKKDISTDDFWIINTLDDVVK